MLAVFSCFWVSHAFREGDFIQTARKAQFHQTRTHWHDLLGHHCPKFGVDRTVVVPLPQPQLVLTDKDDYKIQLSFDGDRHVTPWLTIIGKYAPTVPILEVELRRSGDELLGVNAKVLDAPVSYQHMHVNLVEEYRNISAWPKHLLIKYRFHTRNDVDLDRGLYMLFIVGLLFTVILIVNAASGVQQKLAQFLQEVAGDEPANGSTNPTVWKGPTGKAE